MNKILIIGLSLLCLGCSKQHSEENYKSTDTTLTPPPPPPSTPAPSPTPSGGRLDTIGHPGDTVLR